ncbi:hypothetical protein EVA_22159, partial [gut metagenome]
MSEPGQVYTACQFVKFIRKTA